MSKVSTKRLPFELGKDERGSVLPLFALMSTIAIAAVGGAVDYGRTWQLKSQMQNALDGAVTSGLTLYQREVGGGTSESQAWTDAQAEADAVFKAQFGNVMLQSDINARNQAIAAAQAAGQTPPPPLTPGLDQPVLNFNFIQAGTQLIGSASVTANTPFMNMVIGSNLSATVSSTADLSGTTINQTNRYSVEVGMMIDLTGSMGSSTANNSTRIQDLITAASTGTNSLLNILLPDSGANDSYVRIGIAPFADYVNAGSYAPLVTGLASSGASSSTQSVSMKYSKYNNLAVTKNGYYGNNVFSGLGCSGGSLNNSSTGTCASNGSGHGNTPPSSGASYGASGSTTAAGASYQSSAACTTNSLTLTSQANIYADDGSNGSLPLGNGYDNYGNPVTASTSGAVQGAYYAASHVPPSFTNSSYHGATGYIPIKVGGATQYYSDGSNGTLPIGWAWNSNGYLASSSDAGYVSGNFYRVDAIGSGNTSTLSYQAAQTWTGSYASTPNNASPYCKNGSYAYNSSGTKYSKTSLGYSTSQFNALPSCTYAKVYVSTYYLPVGSQVTTQNPSCTQVSDQLNGQLITCVTERTGTHAYDDQSITSGGYVGSFAQGKGGADVYSSDGKCYVAGRELPAVIPLTNNKTTLKNFFANATVGGGTPGHLGTAWAWYLISPNWSTIWPAASAPVQYNSSSTKKVAIIMTDGEYNEQYSSVDSATQALNVCAGMRAAGITVYTIGFGFGSNVTPPANVNSMSASQRTTLTSTSSNGRAVELLAKCSSGNSNNYFYPYDGATLAAAFQSIGNSINGMTTSTTTSQGSRITN